MLCLPPYALLLSSASIRLDLLTSWYPFLTHLLPGKVSNLEAIRTPGHILKNPLTLSFWGHLSFSELHLALRLNIFFFSYPLCQGFANYGPWVKFSKVRSSKHCLWLRSHYNGRAVRPAGDPPTKLKTFTIWPFTGHVCWFLPYIYH